MKKLTRILALILAFSFVMILSSCGKKPTENTAAVKTVKAGVLTMGTNATFPPYEFYDSGKIVGIDAEIAKAIADKLGLQLEIKDIEFATLISSLESKNIDIIAAGMTVTNERKQQVNFSDSYAKGVQVIIVKENSVIKSVDDLKNKKIGVQESTTGDIYATDDFGKTNKELIKRFNKGTDAVSALKNGQVDAVIIDNEPAKEFVKANPGTKILSTPYIEEEYAIAMSKENPELQVAINKAISELKADGTLQKIVDKYIPTTSAK